jgi:hypothetical protein
MAASVYVPSSTDQRLAPVIPLWSGALPAVAPLWPQVEGEGEVDVAVPSLRLIQGGSAAPGRLGRRATAAFVAGLVVILAAMLTLGVASASSPELEVGGHVVLQPGETLWDVAVRSAPPGVDVRRQLADIRQLNGFDGATLDAWTVVLLPG